MTHEPTGRSAGKPATALGAAADTLLRDHAVFRLVFNRFHRVSPRLFRSGQPTPAQLRRWTRSHGLRTVINLRGRHPFATYGQEIAACREFGLAHIDFRLDSRGAPPKDRMLQLLDMADGLDYPALAHCKTGADRAGLFAAAFLHGVEGRPVGLAQRQLGLRYGHFRQAKTGILDFFFERYVRDAGGQGFRRWLEDEYDPAALKADFMSQWWATILVDRILRRE
ncbi:MAG: protein tyrosine phosphatase [Rhodospirillaceae bacterium]|nr:protein tyrosine phosphatase [Rhodospirillaceae bacterium]